MKPKIKVMNRKYFLKHALLMAVMICCSIVTNAQDKVKGSRLVVNDSRILENFTKLKVTDGLEVTLLEARTPGYDLEMDDNLIELIDFDTRDSLLTISLRKTIRSSKKLDITLRYISLEEIMVVAKAKVVGKNMIQADDFMSTVLGGSELDIELKSNTATFTMDDNSRLELDYKGDDLVINASDNAFAKADINTDTFTLIASGRTDLEFSGNANESTITLDDDAEFKARAFDIDTVKLIARGSTKTTLTADKDILIDMSDKSELTLYGEPAITVDRMTGTTVLQKKE